MSDANRADIFAEYYQDVEFVDRYVSDPDKAITVIIPVIHSNGFWRKNLASFYREIPIARLLLADGGCIDDTVQVAQQFPRVEVLDHRGYKSLGYSIRGLIEAVDTPWFAYLQSDVYLPPGWFDEMWSHTTEYDWFGCRERHTVMVEYDGTFGSRPWAGSQMGKRDAFASGLDSIEDDYVYRQEDYIFANLVKQAGFVEGKVDDTFHYHQTQFKESPFSRRVIGMKLEVETSPEEQRRQWAMHGRGIVKYLPPNSWDLAIQVAKSNSELRKLGFPDEAATAKWIRQTNPGWLWKVRVASAGLKLGDAYASLVNIPSRVAKGLARGL